MDNIVMYAVMVAELVIITLIIINIFKTIE